MDELEQLQSQIHELQKKAEHLAAQRKASAITEIKAKILTLGITAKDLGLSLGEGKRSTVAVKYRLGDQTWTGRGKAPKFIVEFQAKGGKLEDILV